MKSIFGWTLIGIEGGISISAAYGAVWNVFHDRLGTALGFAAVTVVASLFCIDMVCVLVSPHRQGRLR